MIDLIVAGAGPAGLCTALFARAAGMSVTIVEPRAGPIDKACGEGLLPGAVRLLTELGLSPSQRWPDQLLVGIKYLDIHHVAEARFRSGPGYGVRRDLLQAALYQLAVDRGVEFVSGRIDAVEQTSHRVVAAGFTARYLAAADGLHSPIRQSLGLQRPDRLPPRWGLRQHVEVAPWSDCVEVHWSATSELYLTPLGPDLLSVALLTGRRAPLDEQLASDFPHLAKRLYGTGDHVRGAGALRQRVSNQVAGRVLLVGDAAGYVDALTGEGIDIAARSARELIRCVTADRPADYPAAWRRVTRRYRLLTTSLLAVSRRESLRPRLVRTAEKHPQLFERAVALLCN